MKRIHLEKIAVIVLMVLINFPAPAQETENLFSLSLEDILNMEIFSASKKAENIFDSPLSATVITREEINNSGVTTIEEIFRLVPGMIVREETNGNFDIHMRGLDNVPPGNFIFFSENMMSLVMIDGRKVYNNMSGGTLWETLPISVNDVERIEIIRGPATALYGPNAVTGVINFITRKPENRTIAANASASMGSPNSTIADVGLSSSLWDNKIKVRVSGLYENRERFQDEYYGFVSGQYGGTETIIDYMSMSPTGLYAGYENNNLSKNRMSGNVSVFADLNKNVHLGVSGGYQKSEAQAILMETTASPLSFRESETQYVNITADVHGFNAQVSNNSGQQDIYEGNRAGHFDLNVLDATLEYQKELGPVTLRPGVSYQKAVYNDMPYVGDSGGGHLNGEKELTNTAVFLRSEFSPVDPLRLIAAVRMDQYDYPDKKYFTYQLASTYAFGESTLGRLVVSRANRGPFMLDIHISYVEHPEGATLRYLGVPDLKLPTSDMIELGLRQKISDKIQLDVEAFYTSTKDFTTFEPDELALGAEGLSIYYRYKNIDAVARQMGLSANVSFVVNSKLQGRVFATLQNTKLENFDKRVAPMIIDPANMVFALPQYDRDTVTHEQTPSVFGGLSLNYKPFKKFNVNASLYYLGEHVYRHDYAAIAETFGMGQGETTVDAKFMSMVHASYKVYKNNALFLTVRNFIQDGPEFGFSDDIGMLVMSGLKVNL